MKERFTAFFLLFLALLTVWAVVKKKPSLYGTLPETRPVEDAGYASSLSDEVIRLHILADSDSEKDQQIKLLVRDALLPYLSAATVTASTKEEAAGQLMTQCDQLTRVANQTLKSLNAEYSARIFITDCYFPLRIYGTQTYLSKDAVLFPPGNYTSVQVVLGRGLGHNWWCLAYPALCFIDATYDCIPKESAAYLEAFATLPKSAVKKLFYDTESFFRSSDECTPPEKETQIQIYLDSKLLRLLKSLFRKEN